MSNRRSFLQSALLLPSLFAVDAFAQDNKVATFADFESGDYSDWTITGDAFGTKPATDALFPGKVRGFGGRAYASTFHPRRGVLATGRAVSREFTIEKPVITFRIGGGNHAGSACLNLVVDGKIERTETGDGTAQLVSRSWDVSALVGKTARLEIVDDTTSDKRGYVMVDDIAFGVSIAGEQDPGLQSRLVELLETTREKYKLPAVFASVGYRGRIRASYCCGLRKVGYGSSVTLNDRVMIGSISKSFTPVIVGNLVSQSVINEATTIGSVLTELYDVMNPAYRNATVWQLLKHIAGITKDGFWKGEKSASEWRYAWAVSLLKSPPAAPSGQFFYSSGHEIVAVMCERITGLTYERLLSKYAFDPCGMKSAGMGKPYDDGSKTGRDDQPWGHIIKEGRTVPCELSWNTHMFCAASGGISCTIDDLCKYGNAMAPAIIRSGAETPLGKVAYRIVRENMGWGGRWGGDGATGLGDYSSLSISDNTLVVCVHSTLDGEKGGKDANYEIIAKIKS